MSSKEIKSTDGRKNNSRKKSIPIQKPPIALFVNFDSSTINVKVDTNLQRSCIDVGVDNGGSVGSNKKPESNCIGNVRVD